MPIQTRNIVKTIAPAVAGLLTLVSTNAKSQVVDSGKTKPNVLFLIVDDMNNYGFFDGYPGVKMPYMDHFKKSAVTFDQAYCGSPVCTPSRASVFSGMYPHTTGAYFNGSDPWRKSEPLIECETMPECFKRNGYTTWGRGKLFHAKLTEGRIEKNFDNRPIYMGGFKPFPDEDHQVKGKFWGIQSYPDSIFPDVKNANAAIDFLKESHDNPFFLALGLWRPHTPFTCPQRFYDMYDMNDITLPKGYKKGDIDDIPELAKRLLDPFHRFNEADKLEWREIIRAYLACNSFADWNIGRVIEALDKSPYAKNTIVVFWSDNGYHCGEKNHWEKNTLWEQGSRVPLAIRIPGNKNDGEICSKPVSLVDLYNTLVDYCGIQPPKKQLQGESLRPLLENTDARWNHPALVTYGEGYAAICDGRYRYIQYADGTAEFYDDLKDPYEFKNLIDNSDYQDIIGRLKKYVPKKFAKNLPGRVG